MPEVTIEAERLDSKLSTVERLKKQIAGEADIAEFHDHRSREARQRMRAYEEELAKFGGEPMPESPVDRMAAELGDGVPSRSAMIELTKALHDGCICTEESLNRIEAAAKRALEHPSDRYQQRAKPLLNAVQAHRREPFDFLRQGEVSK